jgi:glycosyltransferase involved in cell wall biosynthesis
MFISVIIPTCNRNELLGKCLDRLAPGKQSLDSASYEVIVTDDGHEYQAENYCKENYPFVLYTKGPRKGPAANRNNGARIANGNWLVFTDDDCLPDSGLLQAYVQSIEPQADCKAFEGAILPDDWELLKKDLSDCPVNTSGGCFWSANIAVEGRLFNTIGGFDERFKIAAMEDKDIYQRLKAVTSIPFLKEAVVIHEVRFLPFFKMVSKINPRLRNWFFYETKYNGFREVALKGTKFQMQSIFSNFKAGKFKKSLYHLVVLIHLMPFLIKQKIVNEGI